jgi:dehydrogenase/reductase SDR family protein 4
MKRLQSKVAIVTASTRGIGLEIARRLCSEGASVVISSRKADAVQAAVDDLRKQGLVVEGTSCHVGNAADRQKLLDFTLSKFGRYCSTEFPPEETLSFRFHFASRPR